MSILIGVHTSSATPHTSTHSPIPRVPPETTVTGAAQAYGVPVATVRMTDFHSTLERLHDYLLECMELAMRPN